MAAIKRFFEKKKMDVKFKKAGGGHKLTEDTRTKPNSRDLQPSVSSQSSRPRSSGETRRAGEAALNRLSQPKPGTGQPVGTGAAAIKAHVRREMEAEKAAQIRAHQAMGPQEVYKEGAPMLAVSGVLFHCPMVGPAILPRKEMEAHIQEFLLAQLAEEPEMTSALMIQTLNKDKEKIKVCMETLCKYLDNVIKNPTEEKFRKIRLNNKVFQERVASLEGANEFLQAVGFETKMLPGPSEAEEAFYVINEEKASDGQRLQTLKEILEVAEPIRPELYRNPKVYHPSPNASRIQVPDEFYNVTPEELKREQQLKNEAVERLGVLRTKEMREREHLKELRRYRYTLIRVRFPEGVILQGTFRAAEKLFGLVEFVRNNLVEDWIPFILSSSTGQKLSEEDKSLAELGLAPAAIVNFEWDASILAEVTAQQGSRQRTNSLKPELMETIESL